MERLLSLNKGVKLCAHNALLRMVKLRVSEDVRLHKFLAKIRILSSPKSLNRRRMIQILLFYTGFFSVSDTVRFYNFVAKFPGGAQEQLLRRL
jgi:hypothetical protein